MSTQCDATMIDTFKNIYEYLKVLNIAPKFHILENECSKAVQKYIKSEKVEIQLVEPHNHQVNAAEPAVKEIKYHIISALATVERDFPIQIWEKFIPQIQDTLNLLRTSRQNASISSYQEMEGVFDFDKTPISILGSKSLSYIDPDTRAAWEQHAEDGLYIGRCPMHYRLLEFFITSMRSYQKTGTYKVMPMHCKVPIMSDQDKTIIAATELIESLRETTPSTDTDKSRHATTIADPTAIITDSPSQRVILSRSPRVANRIATTTPAPRVTGRATTETNQKTTRNNTPIPPPTACHALYQTPRSTHSSPRKHSAN